MQALALKALLALAVIVALMGLGAAVWQRVPGIGPAAVQTRLAHQVDTMTAARDAWRTSAGEWEKSYRKSEGIRDLEQGQARQAVADEAKTCTARVAEARRSAAAIRTLTRQEPPRDETGCPIRQLVPADSLRDALQPPAR